MENQLLFKLTLDLVLLRKFCQVLTLCLSLCLFSLSAHQLTIEGFSAFFAIHSIIINNSNNQSLIPDPP